MTRVLPAKERSGAGQGCVRLLAEILGEMTLEKCKAAPAGHRQEGRGSARCAAEGAPQLFSQRALSGGQPKAPGAAHPVLQWDIPNTAAGADCQEMGRELVAGHQRGWKSAKPGLVTIQGPHF